MTSSLTIWNVVFLAAMTQGMLLSLFLLANKKGHRNANRWLALLILAYSIDIGLETLYSSPLVFAYPHLIGFNDALFFLYGPLLYLYAYFLCSPQIITNKKWLFHFLPFLLVIFFYLPTLFTQSAEFKLSSEGLLPSSSSESGESRGSRGSGLNALIDAEFRGRIELASGFHELVYLGLTLLLLKRHASSIKDSFSAIDRINLSWLRNLTLATGVIVTIDLLLYFFVAAQQLAFGNAVNLILFLCAALIYAVGYMGLRQPAIFSADHNPAVANHTALNHDYPASSVADESITDESSNDEGRGKYYKSTLTDEQAEQSLAQLLELMETQKLYLQGDLTLPAVAEALGLSTNNLSQIINDKLQQNFYDFVNAYRVEAAKKMIADPANDNLTLLAIAYDAGFNSKSAFNSVFKKRCEMTPTQFKKSISVKAA